MTNPCSCVEAFEERQQRSAKAGLSRCFGEIVVKVF